MARHMQQQVRLSLRCTLCTSLHMVVTERHLWVNLADIGKKERAFFSMLQSHLPSFLVPPSRWSRSLERPRRAQRPSKPSFQEGPGLSPNNAGVLAHLGLGIREWAQKSSVTTRAPPLPAGRARGTCRSKRGRQDLKAVIHIIRSQQSFPDQSKP